jgi:cysteine synthase
MTPEEAEEHLAQDTELYDLMEEAGMLDERIRRIGRPRIGDNNFHLTDLPEWVEIDANDRFETVRMLVRQAEQQARRSAGDYVVIERDGKMALVKRAYVLDDDGIVWETMRR